MVSAGSESRSTYDKGGGPYDRGSRGWDGAGVKWRCCSGLIECEKDYQSLLCGTRPTEE